MVKVLLLTLVLMAVVMLLLGFRVFFTKRWSFPNTHVDGNKELTDRGLSCHRSQHREAMMHKNLADRIAAKSKS